jgi:hypothetical protein
MAMDKETVQLLDTLRPHLLATERDRAEGRRLKRYTVTIHDPAACRPIVRTGYLDALYRQPPWGLSLTLVNHRSQWVAHWPPEMFVSLRYANRRDGGIIWQRNAEAIHA